MFKKLMIWGAAIFCLTLGAKPVQAAALHEIGKGESLFQIAAHNSVSVVALKQANGLAGDLIYPGQSLAIPAAPQKIEPPRAVGKNLNLLARLVTAEAGGEPFKGKVAVAAVIINRTKDLGFPDTIAGNIFKPNEFESVSNGLIWGQPSQESFHAAREALQGWDPTYGAKYFFNPAKVHGASWVWTRTIVEQIGHHVFGV